MNGAVWEDSNRWNCERCTFLNVRAHKVCDMCGGPQPDFPATSSADVELQKALLASTSQPNKRRKVDPPTLALESQASSSSAGSTSHDGDMNDIDEDDANMSDNADGDGWGDWNEDGDDEELKGDDGDWGDFADENDLALQRQSSSYVMGRNDVTIHDNESLGKLAKQTASRLAGQLCVDRSDVVALLRYFRWNEDKLTNSWWENNSKVRAEVGIAHDKLVPHPIDPTSKEEMPETFMCFLCIEDVPWDKTFSLVCGHLYCKTCWANYANAEMDKGPRAVFTACIEPKCKELIPEKHMLSFLDQRNRARMKSYYQQSFVDGSPTLRWCPYPNCGNVVQYVGGGAAQIPCTCGHVFCFSCGNDGHVPVSCQLVDKWATKNSSDQENVNWIKANTKECPKCKVHIEKNQGCNHMTCRKCRHEFCWLCYGDWRGHSACNRRKEIEQEEADRTVAKNDLKRYMFYFERYENHRKSIKFAEATRMKAEDKMVKVQRAGVGLKSLNDVQFVLDGVDEIIEGRRVLQWTYCYGYYLEEAMRTETEVALYSNQQAQLEDFVDRLHGMIELSKVEKLSSLDFRAEVIRMTRVAKKFRNNLCAHIDQHSIELE